MKVKSESEGAQSCPTLSDPMDCSPPGSSIHGIFQARVLGWGAIAFSAPTHTHMQNKKKQKHKKEEEEEEKERGAECQYSMDTKTRLRRHKEKNFKLIGSNVPNKISISNCMNPCYAF